MLGNSNDSSSQGYGIVPPAPADWSAQIRADQSAALGRSNAGGASIADYEAKIFSTFTNNGDYLPGVPSHTGIEPTAIPPAVNANDFALAISAGFPIGDGNVIAGPYTFWKTNTGVAYVKSNQPISGLSNEAGVTRQREQQARAYRSKPSFISRLWR